jgi:hypothetical protein
MENGFGQLFDDAGFGLDDMKRDALGGTRADAGKLIEGANQRGDWFGENGHWV